MRTDMARIAQVLDLVRASKCQSASLALHFGEQLDASCGICTFCREQKAQVLQPEPAQPSLPAGLDVAAFSTLRDAHARAIGHPRQAARFLCGLTSPATTQAKLSRHPLFGVLAKRRFRDVLTWCSA